MKKLFALFLIFILVLSPSAFVCAEGDSLFNKVENKTDVSLSLPIKSIEKGDDVYIEVSANDVSNLYAFSATFTYDDKAFDFSNIKSAFKTELGEDVIRTDVGRVTYVFTNVGENNECTNKLIRLTLTAKKNGSFKVCLDKLTMVYDDFSFSEYEPKVIEITIADKSKKTAGGGGGGGSSAGFSTGSGFTASAAPAPMATPMPAATATPIPDFVDLDSVDWAREAISVLRDKEIINGYADNKFMPSQKVTRAEFAKMISEAFNLSDVPESKDFADVLEDDWFYKPVMLCSGSGIILGDEYGFRPNDSINREEMAVMILRAITYSGAELSIEKEYAKFNDEEYVSEFALEAIHKLYCAGILSGDTDGSFRPKDGVIRAEAAKVIYEVIK